MRKWLLLILISALLLISSCQEENPYTEYQFIMDTQCAVTVYKRADRQAIAGVFSLLRELDSKLDRFNESSEVYRINLNAGSMPVSVSDDTFRLISRAYDLCLATDGAFNPLMGRVSDLWGFESTNERVPSAEETSSLVSHTDISGLVLDEEEHTVYLVDSQAALDLGAIAKGWASQLAADYLKSRGVERATVNLGGNVYVIGQHKDGRDWVVGIQNPYAETGGYYATVQCHDEAVVTSGGYQKNFVRDGVVYHHILDPETGRPSDSDLISISIISADGALADAFSTACFVLGYDETVKLCEEYNVRAVALTEDDEVKFINF